MTGHDCRCPGCGECPGSLLARQGLSLADEWRKRALKLAAEMRKQRPAITAVFDREAWDLAEKLKP